MNDILKKRIEEEADAEMSQYYNDDEYPCGIKDIQSDFKEAFKKGAEYALSHQWIIVDEALPKEDSSVFMNVYVEVNTGHGIGYCVLIAKYAFGKFSCETKNVKVIGWMPIPKFDDKNNK